MSNVISLAAERERRVINSFSAIEVVLTKAEGQPRYSVYSIEGDEPLSGKAKEEALMDAWIAMAQSEEQLSAFDTVVAYIVVRKGGFIETWTGEDAQYQDKAIVEWLEEGVGEIKTSLVPEKIG